MRVLVKILGEVVLINTVYVELLYPELNTGYDDLYGLKCYYGSNNRYVKVYIFKEKTRVLNLLEQLFKVGYLDLTSCECKIGIDPNCTVI